MKTEPRPYRRLDPKDTTVTIGIEVPTRLKLWALGEAGKRDLTMSAFIRGVLEDRRRGE
jgi:hypothetical protein